MKALICRRTECNNTSPCSPRRAFRFPLHHTTTNQFPKTPQQKAPFRRISLIFCFPSLSPPSPSRFHHHHHHHRHNHQVVVVVLVVVTSNRPPPPPPASLMLSDNNNNNNNCIRSLPSPLLCRSSTSSPSPLSSSSSPTPLTDG